MKTPGLYTFVWFISAAIVSGPAWPLTIESPQSGEQVMPGQTVWLIVQPSSGTEANVRAVQVLAPGASGCENVQPAAPIQCQLTIPDGSEQTPVPTAVDIRVTVTFADGTESNASTHVVIATTTEALMALQGDPREDPLVFDSVGQEKDLTVLGRSLDGATHDLRGRIRGTIYDISDPKVVHVRNDGRVVAKGAGTATITIRNGSFSFEVPVVVGSGTKVRQ